MSRSPWLYVAAGIAMIAIYLAFGTRPIDPRPLGTPQDIAQLSRRGDVNVLFILVDTLRRHRLSSYGYERNTSPNIDALANTGVRFTRHTSQSSWTKCSMASMWSGMYPARTGVLRYGDVVAEAATMPAESFRDAGYRTAGLWRNGWVSTNFGFSQGFEIYHRPQPTPLPANVRNENPNIKLQGTDMDVISSATEFLRTHQQTRWFLYLHLMDVHQFVSDAESARFGTSYSDIYDNSIRWTDQAIGVLIRELDRLGLRDKTLIVFTADHGEAFGEHGIAGHARDVHAEVSDIPWILSFPFRLDPGLVVDLPTGNVDIWPTVLELVGLPVPTGLDGRSLVAALTAPGALPEDGHAIFSQLDRTWGRANKDPDPIVAVAEGRYRLIRSVKNPGADQLFDLVSDPLEQHDLSRQQPEIAARLGKLVDDYLANAKTPWGDTPQMQLDELELNQLRALGYAIP